MGKIKKFIPLKLFCGIIFSNPDDLDNVKTKLEKKFKEIDYISPIIDFNQTAYYEPEMGKNLKKAFFSFAKLIKPEDFYKAKIFSNRLEEQYLINGKRLVNIDPGAVSAYSVMLLTSKNFFHRVPLRKGIYAELTLIWQNRAFQDLDWTYPDYKTKSYKDILTEIRNQYMPEYQKIVKE